jgi:hypothetical protein
MASEVSVDGLLVPFFWAYGRQNIMAEEHGGAELFTQGQEAEKGKGRQV